MTPMSCCGARNADEAIRRGLCHRATARKSTRAAVCRFSLSAATCVEVFDAQLKLGAAQKSKATRTPTPLIQPGVTPGAS